MRSILLSLLLLLPSLALADHHEEPAGDDAPADEAPADEAPADEAPADEAPAEDAPAEEAPADEAPSEEAPAEDAPAEEAAAEEAPAAEEAVVEAAPAEAATVAPTGKQCTYNDLQGDFTVTVACDLLQDHTGHSQPHKRIWLGGAASQFNIIEVPDPYREADLADIMGSLGRDWGGKKTPKVVSSTPVERHDIKVGKSANSNLPMKGMKTTFGGMEALVITENKQRSTSTTWLFSLNGRNVIANVVALGRGSHKRKAHLAEVVAAVEAGFRLN